MELKGLLRDIKDAIVRIDASREPFRAFQPGVGPYGEPQLVKLIAGHLNRIAKYGGGARTKKSPDLFVPGQWAVEFKIARPFGDNGEEAENWSVNLLHPYPGSVSLIGDCLKLLKLEGRERRAAVVIGYEHVPPKIDLTTLIESFEVIAKHVFRMNLSERIEIRHEGLIHVVHQAVRIFGWEVLDRIA